MVEFKVEDQLDDAGVAIDKIVTITRYYPVLARKSVTELEHDLLTLTDKLNATQYNIDELVEILAEVAKNG